MIVTGASNPVNAWSTARIAAPMRQITAAEPARLADQVSISDAGKQAAANAAATTGIEQYALPNWFADFGFALDARVATVQADGTLAGGARGDWFAQKYPEAAAATQSERDTYSRRIDAHYQSLLRDNGVNDTASHYQTLIVDQAASENLHQQMVERIKADPVLSALLPRMGKAHLLT